LRYYNAQVGEALANVKAMNNIPGEVANEIIRDYVKGGYKLIPTIIKTDYDRCIVELDSKFPTLGKLNVKELQQAGMLRCSVF
jgi:hypothetical protein